MGYIDNLRREDHQIIEDFMYKEYWHMMSISCMYPNLSTPKWRVFSLLLLAFYVGIIFYYMIIFAVTAVKSTDLLDTFQDMHYIILLFMILVVIIPFNHNRPTISRIHHGIAAGLSNYDLQTEVYRDVLKKPLTVKRKQLIFLVLLSFSILTSFVIILSPLLDELSGVVKEDIYTKYDISTNLPIPMWTPLGSDTWLTKGIAFVTEVVVALVAALIIAGADLMSFVIAEYLALELDLLSYALTRLPQRALNLYNTTYSKSESSISNIKHDAELMKCYKKCLSQCIVHHQKIIDLFNRFTAMDSVVLFLTHSVGAMIIGVSGALILFAEGKLGSRILSTVFCIVEILNLFFEDWFSEQMIQASERLSMSLYSTKWMITDAGTARTIQIMMIRSQRPLMMNYANIMDFNYNTFTTLMNSAYSYFNLLFAFVEDLS